MPRITVGNFRSFGRVTEAGGAVPGVPTYRAVWSFDVYRSDPEPPERYHLLLDLTFDSTVGITFELSFFRVEQR